MIASIRRRLAGILLVSIIGALGAVAVLVELHTRQEVGALLDQELARTAQFLMTLAPFEVTQQDANALGRDFRSYEAHPCLAFQVWRKDGTLVVHTPNVPQETLPPSYPLGFSDLSFADQDWRVLHIKDPQLEDHVQVAECYEDRDAVTRHIILQVVRPLLWSLPVVILLVWLGVGRGLAPLGRLAREVSGRDPRSLDEIPTATVPSEVLPLVQALNRLFQRLGSAFLAQRRFTADAAHELRTPLAGVKTQAQVAMRAPDPAERQRALEQVLRGVARAGHLVEQLLVLARIDRESADIAFAHPDLHKIAVSVLSEMSPHALARGVELELEGDRGVPVRGSPDLLSILLRNLVDNAVRHTQPSGRVLVRVTREQVGASFTVEDNGPGIPLDQRERVFARFYRLDCAAGEGSGLGLSIVQRISALHGATISLQDGPSGTGLLVEVRFPEPRILPVKVPAASAAN